jgi:ATP-independent RNA helicase DbpA
VAVSLVEEREEWRWQGTEALLPDAFPKKCGIPDAKRSADTLSPAMTTIQINGGRKIKLRPGDLLGALTADGGVPGDSVGSIDLFDTRSYVAIRNADARKALRQLANRPIKGRKYRARVSGFVSI